MGEGPPSLLPKCVGRTGGWRPGGSLCSVMNTGVHEGLLDIGEFQTRIRDPSGRVEGNPGLESPQSSASVGDGSTPP